MFEHAKAEEDLGRKVLFVKNPVDRRYMQRIDETSIVSHDGVRRNGLVCGNLEVLLLIIKEYNIDSVFIDEAHFWGENLVESCRKLTELCDVFLSALNCNHLLEPFDCIARVMVFCDNVEHLALNKCAFCDNSGTVTLRRVPLPDPITDLSGWIGGAEKYSTTCIKCFEMWSERFAKMAVVKVKRFDSLNSYYFMPGMVSFRFVSAHDISFKARERSALSTCMTFSVPSGYTAVVLTEPSSYLNNFIVHTSVITNENDDTLFLYVQNMSFKRLVIKKGTRVAQLLFFETEKLPSIRFGLGVVTELKVG
jgi:thymidine kinase